MAIKLYDLAGEDENRRFSPSCWRITMALAHKGLDADAVPWRFTEKDQLPEGCTGHVPVLVDGDTVVHESSVIARHLDEAYPDRPKLFDGPAAVAYARFVETYWSRVVHPAAARVILKDLFGIIAEKDKAYFRESREKMFGMAIEKVSEDTDALVPAFQKTLEPLRSVVKDHAYLGGTAPTYADYVAFGAFAWARAASPIKLLETDDPVHAWRERMMDLHGGLARNAVGYAV